MIRGILLTAIACTSMMACFSSYAEDSGQQLNILTSFPPDFYQNFKSAFSARHPDIQVIIRNKKTTAGIKYLMRQPENNIDLFWASAPDAFDILDNAGLLAEVSDVDFDYPHSISGYPLRQEKNRYLGFALSGYGIMSNRAYIQRWNLPPATQWADLADPVYFSHLGLSSPSRSGTTHLMIEMILQQYGWKKGWNYILQIASNAVTITARSYGVPEGVQQGHFGLGLVIDFLARKIDSSNIDFAYADETRYLPASIALLKNSKNPQAARKFIRFMLSREGQRLLLEPGIARLPIDPDLYADGNKQINPYFLAQRKPVEAFNAIVSRERYQFVNLIFDHLITFQHKSMQRLRKKLILAASKLKAHALSDTEYTRQLGEIESELFNFPVHQGLSEDRELLSTLERTGNSVLLAGYLPEPLASIKQSWIQKLIDLESRVEHIMSDYAEIK